MTCPCCGVEPTDSYEPGERGDRSVGLASTSAVVTVSCDCQTVVIDGDADRRFREWDYDGLLSEAFERWAEYVAEKHQDELDAAADLKVA